MKTLLTVLFVGLVVSGGVDGQLNSIPPPGSSRPTVETIVCIRHGEKPRGGLGQLTCRGLNRALALPDVLLAKYGPPQFLFAPSPTQKVDGLGGYYYVRPLMTIEPTAIRCGLPVNAQFGYREIKGLESELQKQQYQSATIFIAWEHLLLDEFVKDLLRATGGDPARVPSWPENDYDSIFIVRINHSLGGQSAAFTIDHEGLNDLTDAWPRIAHR